MIKNYLKGLLISPPTTVFFFFQPRLAFAELSLDLISELSCNVSVPIFWDCTLSVTTNTLDSIPKHQHNNNVSLSGSPSPLPGTGTYITPPTDPLDLLVCELRKCVAVVLVFKLCGRKHFKTSLVSAHLADVTRKPRLITISSLSSAAVWQKQISLQIDDFCHMAYFIPALIFLSAVVITLSLMLFIKIAQAVAENSHSRTVCVCVWFWERSGWWVEEGKGDQSLEAQHLTSQKKRMSLTVGHADSKQPVWLTYADECWLRDSGTFCY